MKTSRKVHLDLLRILAAYFVIFNHTAGFSLFQAYPPESVRYWGFLTVSVICKVSVPLFFMISGALLLGKRDEPIRRVLLRVLRVAMALLVFSFISYLQQISQGTESFDIARFFLVLVGSDWLNVYWYLYAFLAYLLALPFLRTLAAGLKPGHYLYLIALSVVFSGILPVVLPFVLKTELSVNWHFSFGWLLGNVPLYPLTGYYLENILDIKKVTRWKLLLIWLAAIIGIMLTCWATHCDILASGGFSQNYILSFVILPCIALYITGKKLFSRCIAPWLSKALIAVGSCTFGLYLVHGQLLRAPRTRLFFHLYHHLALHPMVYHLILCLDVMLIGLCITWILRKIPIIKKML